MGQNDAHEHRIGRINNFLSLFASLKIVAKLLSTLFSFSFLLYCVI